MSLNGINGIPPQVINNIYRCTGKEDGRYTLQGSRLDAEKTKLDKKLENGEISEGEYNQKKNALNNIPDTIFSDGQNVQFSPIRQKEESTENVSSRIEQKAQNDIIKLENQHKNGEISDFEYRANLFMMTNPFIQGPNESGMKLNAIA